MQRQSSPEISGVEGLVWAIKWSMLAIEIATRPKTKGNKIVHLISGD
jgi:hypothetical protein